MKKPNILILVCDQLRHDCIGALGNEKISTPNIDRLVCRGATFTRAYTPCTVCIPSRYAIMTGNSPFTTGITTNQVPDSAKKNFGGSYLAEVMRQSGYRTFGIGKFHTVPFNEPLGFETHLHSEELYDEGCETADDYYSFIRMEHPEYNHIEQLHGERSEMYYRSI